MGWSLISDRVLRTSVTRSRIDYFWASGRPGTRCNEPAAILLDGAVRANNSASKGLGSGRKGWNTNGLGAGAVAGRDLQCVIFASLRAY
jgi:hypothetical protein